MAKENFDRSKPHVRITGTDADFGFVFADGSLQVIHYEDGNGDGFVAVNLEANHKALAVDDGSLGSHETTLNLDRVGAASRSFRSARRCRSTMERSASGRC